MIAGIVLLGCVCLWRASRMRERAAKIRPYEQRLKTFFAEKERFGRLLAAQEQTASPANAWPSMAQNNRQSGVSLLSEVKGQLNEALVPREQSKLSRNDSVVRHFWAHWGG